MYVVKFWACIKKFPTFSPHEETPQHIATLYKFVERGKTSNAFLGCDKSKRHRQGLIGTPKIVFGI